MTFAEHLFRTDQLVVDDSSVLDIGTLLLCNGSEKSIICAGGRCQRLARAHVVYHPMFQKLNHLQCFHQNGTEAIPFLRMGFAAG
jgi:hypothetical protein